MARRGNSNRGQRDAIDTSLDDLLAPIEYPRLTLSPITPSEYANPLEIEDRRRFNPERAVRPALSFSGLAANVGDTKGSRPGRAARYPTFTDGRNVLVCVRRKQRREVLFAKKRRGKGGGRRRRNWQSFVRC